jgi:transcriptional regulator with XRE-family HTH domain
MPQVRTVADLGAVVRDARRRSSWTQAELAEQAGVSRQWVVALESGQAARAELGRVLSVLAALDLPMTFPAVESAPNDAPVRRSAARSRGSDRDAPVTPVVLEDHLDLNSYLESFTDQQPDGPTP